MNEIIVGADPELFATDAEGNIVPACGLIGGSKSKPRPVEGGALQEDNVLIEFNIEPARTREEWVARIEQVMAQIPVPYIVRTTHVFNMELLQSIGRQAMEFGCDPDIDAWTGVIRMPPAVEDMDDPGLRTAGGHIHIGGLADASTQTKLQAVAAADALITPIIRIHDPDQRRRVRVYGGGAACRVKEYGVECRSPSNWWLGSRRRMEWAFETAKRAGERAASGEVAATGGMFYKGAVTPAQQRYILQNYKDLGAEDIYEEYKDVIVGGS